jgi:hypothetical protein
MLGLAILNSKKKLGEELLPPFLLRIFRYNKIKVMTQNSTELILRDLKKKRTSILKQLNDVETGHLYAKRYVDSVINAYITLYEALDNEIQNLQDEVKLIKINQGLGLQK